MNFEIIPNALVHPAVGLPILGVILLVISWGLWETVLRDHLVPAVKYRMGLRKFKRTRSRNLKELRKYALQDIQATQQIFRERARHAKQRRARNRKPRHSAAVTS